MRNHLVEVFVIHVINKPYVIKHSDILTDMYKGASLSIVTFNILSFVFYNTKRLGYSRNFSVGFSKKEKKKNQSIFDLVS